MSIPTIFGVMPSIDQLSQVYNKFSQLQKFMSKTSLKMVDVS